MSVTTYNRCYVNYTQYFVWTTLWLVELAACKSLPYRLLWEGRRFQHGMLAEESTARAYRHRLNLHRDVCQSDAESLAQDSPKDQAALSDESRGVNAAGLSGASGNAQDSRGRRTNLPG